MSRESLRRNDFRQFLLETAVNGYANIETIPRVEADGSKTIEIAEGGFRMRDNWFTSVDQRRFYGNEVIFYQERPLWFMGYSGWVHSDADPKEISRFLRRALKRPDSGLPVRGPRVLSEGNWRYSMSIIEPDPSMILDGEPLERFSGTEAIRPSIDYDYLPAAYWGRFTGGMVD